MSPPLPPAAPARRPRQLTLLGSFLASSLSACAACLFTNPMEVIKTRLQLDGEGAAAAAARAPRQYTGIADALRKIAAQEGVRGLQAGLAGAHAAAPPPGAAESAAARAASQSAAAEVAAAYAAKGGGEGAPLPSAAELEANLATHLADANKQWCQRLDDLMKDVLAIRGDMETQRLDNGGAPFVNRLCDELLRMATVLRAPEIAQPLPASTDLERRILAAQEVARVLWSPGSIAGGVSMPASSRHHSPAPSVGSRALG
jgi:hypothetical protein